MVRDYPGEVYKVDTRYFRADVSPSSMSGWSVLKLTKTGELPEKYTGSVVVRDSDGSREIGKINIYGE